MKLNDYVRLNNAIITFDGSRSNGRFLVMEDKDLNRKLIPVSHKAQDTVQSNLSVFKTDTGIIIAYKTGETIPSVTVQEAVNAEAN